MLGEIHEILQNDRFKAVGKVEAIGEVLYGPDGEYADAWEDSDLDPDEEGEEE
jgi:hypothetical protein